MRIVAYKGLSKKEITEKELQIIGNMTQYLNETPRNILDTRGNNAQKWKKEYEEYQDVQKLPDSCDVLILTANQVEANTFLRLLYDINKKPLDTFADMESKCRYHFCEIAGSSIVHVQTLEPSSDTMDGSRNATEYGINKFKPKLVVSLGVAFGNDPDSQRFGDVIISKVLCCYDVQYKVKKDMISLKPKRFHSIDSFLLTAWGNPLSNKDTPNDNNMNFCWHFGTVLSGGGVVDSIEYKLKLIDACNENNYYDVVGGEMEGFGAFDVCQKHEIPFVVIKGICDWGDGKNKWAECVKIADLDKPNNYTDEEWNDFLKDGIQGYAAENAFNALKFLLDFGMIPLICDRKYDRATALGKGLPLLEKIIDAPLGIVKKIKKETLITLTLCGLTITSYLSGISLILCKLQNDNII